MENAIRIERLSKRYVVRGAAPRYGTLREALTGAAASVLAGGKGREESREIWALRDVSFEARPGEVVGIIGRNGAGKSTLLKVLSRITRPTKGTVELRGRVASLLEVGTGFHPELTGRENIFLSGAILGMSRAEVQRHFDSIVSFAGLEQALDTPVKFLSSGMRVRLGFAVAAHLDAEILLADEVLGIGDAAFQAKSHDVLRDIGRQSRTVMIVSHNLGVIAELCQRTILLDRGEVISDGPTPAVIKEYLQRTASAHLGEAVIEPPKVNKGVAITRAAILNSEGLPAADVDYSEDFLIVIEFRVERFVPQLSIGITTTNDNGIRTASSWAVFQEAYSPGLYTARGKFPGRLLAPGRYELGVGAEHYKVEEYHYATGCATFEVVNNTSQFDGSLPGWGVTLPQLRWAVEARGPATDRKQEPAGSETLGTRNRG
jgi:homopolymeric O-antigen transport system ATP-binding protein